MFQFSTVDIKVSAEWIIASLAQVNCVQDCQQYRKAKNVRQKYIYLSTKSFSMSVHLSPSLSLSFSHFEFVSTEK